MNVVLINHYAGSLEYGMEYRPFYLGREMVKLGHQVTVLAASYSHLRIKQPVVASSGAREEIDGIQYIWFETPSYTGNGVGRVINIFTFILRLLIANRRLRHELAPNVVVASSTYPLDIIPALFLARFTQAKLVYEVHDLWPLTLIELAGMSPRHPFVMLLQWAENLAYSKADQVISMLPHASGHMQRHGMAPDKFAYLPNGIDPEEWQSQATCEPLEHERILNQLRDEGKFIVGYVGTHGVANELDTMIESAAQVADQPVAFVLVGKGSEKDRLRAKTVHLGLNNVIFLDPVAKQCIPRLLAHMHALFIGWKKQPIYRFGVCPNKLLDYMMSGRPVIQAIEASNDLVTESRCGISVDAENAEEITRAVLTLMRMNQSDRARMGQNGKEFVMAHHVYPVLADQYVQFLKDGAGADAGRK